METAYIMIVASVLIAHFFADFGLQTSWMAENKSSQWLPLLAHIATYTIAVYAILQASWMTIPFAVLAKYCLLNGGLHLVVDAISSRISKWAFTTGRLRVFWFVIGADQLAHQLCLLATIPLFFG